jgi:hypothetical protein
METKSFFATIYQSLASRGLKLRLAANFSKIALLFDSSIQYLSVNKIIFIERGEGRERGSERGERAKEEKERKRDGEKEEKIAPVSIQYLSINKIIFIEKDREGAKEEKAQRKRDGEKERKKRWKR